MIEWTPDEIPDLTGKVIVVTGANRGLGYEAANMMAARSATVVLAVRTRSKGQVAAGAIRQRAPRATVDVMQLDLGDLSTVGGFADAFMAKYSRLDVLMNSAGIMAVPEAKTKDGFELQFGVNHLGHFALTGMLLDVLTATKSSRVVNVSSRAANKGRMQWDDLQYDCGYRRFGAYGQSKLANLLFTVGLQERLCASGKSTISVAAHPGLSATDLQAGTEIDIPILTPMLFGLYKTFAMNVAKGSASQVRAAVDPAVMGGEYYGPHRGTRGHPVRIDMPQHVNRADSDRLWARSEELTRVVYRFKASNTA